MFFFTRGGGGATVLNVKPLRSALDKGVSKLISHIYGTIGEFKGTQESVSMTFNDIVPKLSWVRLIRILLWFFAF